MTSKCLPNRDSESNKKLEHIELVAHVYKVSFCGLVDYIMLGCDNEK